jgi:DNA repair protein RadC
MTYEIVSERTARKPVRVISSRALYEELKRYAAAQQERFLVITLNTRHEIISITIATIGLVGRSLIHPREVFVKAITDRATAVILCHNHPSGNTAPSSEDIHITRRIAQAGRIIDIPVLDHLIISKTGYFSMREEGLLTNLNTEDGDSKKEAVA